jgi:hypothetical protein
VDKKKREDSETVLNLPPTPSTGLPPRHSYPSFKTVSKKKIASPQIGIERLQRAAGSLDVILVQTANRGMARLLRIATWSDYDHVLFLHRSPVTKKLFVMEAVQSGVVSYGLSALWADWIRGVYSKVAYRQLTVTPDGLNEQQLKQLGKFCNENNGADFGLKGFFVRTKSKKERTFFCSELVAAAYKTVGLLKEGVSEVSFFPRSFASDSCPWLVGGASLGPLTTIIRPAAPRRGVRAQQLPAEKKRYFKNSPNLREKKGNAAKVGLLPRDTCNANSLAKPECKTKRPSRRTSSQLGGASRSQSFTEGSVDFSEH